MTKRTANRLYVYPECNPPLVRDRSDIDFMHQLAVEINNDAATLEFDLQELIEKPDCARISFAGTVTTTGAANGTQFNVPYDTITFDNTTGSTDITSNALRPLQRGWYFVASTVRCTDGGEQQMVINHRRNSRTYQDGRRYEGPSQPITANEENMSRVDIMSANAGDLIQSQVKVSGVGGTFTFEARLAMFQLINLDA